MNTPTIPEIAEMLRAHIRTDNAAPRLIVEHILPLIAEMGAAPILRTKLEEAETLLEMAENKSRYPHHPGK